MPELQYRTDPKDIVYFERLCRSYESAIGKLDIKEASFMADKTDEKNMSGHCSSKAQER